MARAKIPFLSIVSGAVSLLFGIFLVSVPSFIQARFGVPVSLERSWAAYLTGGIMVFVGVWYLWRSASQVLASQDHPKMTATNDPPLAIQEETFCR